MLVMMNLKTHVVLTYGYDDDDDELFLTDKRRLALFPAGTIIRDPHHRGSLTRREQGLNLRRT